MSKTRNIVVLNALKEMRARLMGQIDNRRFQILRMESEIRHVDAVIKMFSPHYDLDRILPKITNRKNLAGIEFIDKHIRDRAVRFGHMILAIAAVLSMPSARADPATSTDAAFLSALRSLQNVATSEDDTKRVLGSPQQEASAGDGMTVLIYSQGRGSNVGGDISGLANLAGLAAFLMPTQMGMATATISGIASMGGQAASTVSGGGSANGGDYRILMLFDRDGRLVCWKGMVDAQAVGSTDGGALANASDDELRQAAKKMAAGTSLVSDGKPHLGAVLFPIPGGITKAETKIQAERSGMVGVLIMALLPGATADRAGLHPNDLVVAIDGELIATADDLHHVLTRMHVGKTVDVLYYRVDPATRRWEMAEGKLTF